MTTANKLTLCRVVMIPIFLVLLYVDFTGHLWAALAVFILASVTDFIDGYVARHYHQITDFGKFMDPLADKLLVMSAMAWFVEVAWMHWVRLSSPWAGTERPGRSSRGTCWPWRAFFRAMSMALLSVTITTKALVFGLSTAKILEKFFAMARKASWTASSASCSLGKICRATWNMSRSYRAARARNLLCSSGPSTMARARASTAPPPFSHMVPLASTSLFFTKYSMPE